MYVWTNRHENKKAADQYFASLNPMAARIIESKHKHVQRIGKETWNKMTVEEQEISLDNYFTSQINCRNIGNGPRSSLPLHVKSVFPKLIVETGQVEIHSLNDNNENQFYKDEHSAPLCWETQSQMNLSLPPSLKEKKESTSTKSLEKNVKSVFKSLKKNGHSHKSKSTKSSTTTKNGNKRSVEKKLPPSKKENYYKQKDVETNYSPSLYKDDSYLKAQNQFEDRKVIVEEPPPLKTQPPVKLRASRSNSNSTKVEVQPRYYDPPTKDHSLTADFQKSKISSHTRINARASLTLDDTEVLLEEKSGAIHNLEVAIKQETQQKKYNDQHLHKSSLSHKTHEMNNEKYETNIEEESPLLNSQSAAIFDSLSFEDKDTSSVRKSGFDFLDDW